MTTKIRVLDPTVTEAAPPPPGKEEILAHERSFLDALVAAHKGWSDRRRALVVVRDDPAGAVDPETDKVRRVPTMRVVLRNLTEKEVDRCNEVASTYAWDKATKTKRLEKFDEGRFACELIATATVGVGQPDEDAPAGRWDDPAVLRALGVEEPHEAVAKALTPLERASFVRHVEEMSGYGTTDPVQQAEMGKA
jgi:hypothetical protein